MQFSASEIYNQTSGHWAIVFRHVLDDRPCRNRHLFCNF